MTDWSMIVRCNKCGKGNPYGSTTCVNCGYEFCVYSVDGYGHIKYHPEGSAHIRPYEPHSAGAFVAQRAVDEIDRAAQVIRGEGLSPWKGTRTDPSELSDSAIADAEAAIGVKLPATLLAVLRIQNGGALYKDSYDEDSDWLAGLLGIVPGCKSDYSLQQMPMMIWDFFEGYLDDVTYQSWRDGLPRQVHPDWGETVRISETIILVSEDGRYGDWWIGLNYTWCGRQGEPSVVRVEMDPSLPSQRYLTEIAPDFLAFLRMLHPW